MLENVKKMLRSWGRAVPSSGSAVIASQPARVG